jgi:dephospho-CoA kinase
MKIIGITGVIGSGKSTLSAILKGQGYAIIDVDKIGHHILRTTNPAKRLVKMILGTTKRAELARIVFTDKKKLKKLSEIMHPAMKSLIRQKLRALQAKNYQGIAIEAAVFVDMALQDIVHELWLVTASEKNIYDRLKQKYSAAELKARLARTSSLSKMKRFATAIIYNNGTISDLQAQVRELIARGR